MSENPHLCAGKFLKTRLPRTLGRHRFSLTTHEVSGNRTRDVVNYAPKKCVEQKSERPCRGPLVNRNQLREMLPRWDRKELNFRKTG